MKIDKASAIYNLMGVGLGSGICIAIGLWIGYSIDEYFKCEPWGIIGGIVLGLASAVTYMLKEIKTNVKKLEEEDHNVKD